jgi:hypothetical protein
VPSASLRSARSTAASCARQVVGQALAELGVVDLGRLVGEVLVTGRRLIVLGRRGLAQCSFDRLPLAGEQLARATGIHAQRPRCSIPGGA